jgi:SAM-dependent methyltransferase
MSVPQETRPDSAASRKLSARLEPFDSYWQAPEDVEAGYSKFGAYYRANFLPHLPTDRDAAILVVSCGPGYLVKLLVDQGYRKVVGIDSDPAKVALAVKRGLDCRAQQAFPFLAGRRPSSTRSSASRN